MCNQVVPLLLLLAAPATLLLHQFGLLASPWVRRAAGVLALGILITRSPEAGFDTVHLDRVKLVLAAAACVLLWLGSRLASAREGEYRTALWLLAISSVLVHWNFLSFHGRGAFVHDHDVAHYYLGSKYFPEIGYGELYVAVIRADAETHGGRPSLREARDLRHNAIVPSAQLLEASEPVRSRFSEARWLDFRQDLEVLRRRLGARYPGFVRDHGYNPTPVWSLLGGALANMVPAGSERGIIALTLIDPLLLFAAFAALGLAFGVEVALVAVTYVALMFGAAFDWVGGAYLRQVWFAASVIGLACLERGVAVPAGLLFALAASLRVFPAFFVLGIGGSVVLALARRRIPERSDGRFLAAFVLGGAALAIATLMFHRGFADWIAFRANMQAHLAGLMSNFVGGPVWARYLEAFAISPSDAVDALLLPAGLGTRVAVALLLALGVVLAVWAATRSTDPARRIAGGVWPIVLGNKVSAYYSPFLVVLVPAFRASRGRLALLFAVETCLYVLGLFEAHFVMLCLFRSLLVIYLLLGLHLDELRTELASGFSRRTPVPEATRG